MPRAAGGLRCGGRSSFDVNGQSSSNRSTRARKRRTWTRDSYDLVVFGAQSEDETNWGSDVAQIKLYHALAGGGATGSVRIIRCPTTIMPVACAGTGWCGDGGECQASLDAEPCRRRLCSRHQLGPCQGHCRLVSWAIMRWAMSRNGCPAVPGIARNIDQEDGDDGEGALSAHSRAAAAINDAHSPAVPYHRRPSPS